MPAPLEGQRLTQRSATVFHPISAADEAAMADLRTIVEPHKGSLRGTAGRVPFDTIMEHVAVPEGVTFEAGTVGGVAGWWSKLKDAQPDAVILHIHGGWFNWGSAKAFRNLAGHLAMHAGAVAFTPACHIDRCQSAGRFRVVSLSRPRARSPAAHTQVKRLVFRPWYKQF